MSNTPMRYHVHVDQPEGAKSRLPSFSWEYNPETGQIFRRNGSDTLGAHWKPGLDEAALTAEARACYPKACGIHVHRVEADYMVKWSLYESIRCPCDSCAGELTEPVDCAVYESCREAVKRFQEAAPPEWLGYESGDRVETDGTGSFRWFSRTGVTGGGYLLDCGYTGSLAWEVSLHPPARVTEASRRRVARLLEVANV